MKSCIKCLEEKSEEDFSWKVKDIKRNNTCRDCHRQYRKDHYQANKAKYIAKARSWEDSKGGKACAMYNISPKKLASMLSKYDGLCWICQKDTATHIDHDHSCCPRAGSCGKCVRGMLCRLCNTGLGMFRDNISLLQEAVVYLNSDIRPSSNG